MIRILDPACAFAAEMAKYYRARGWNPLPSRTDAKRPLVRFREWWDEPAPASLFTDHPTPNIQLMLGRRWKLLAIDLDGPEAQAWWPKACPRTWVTHSGGNGVHLWFRLPASMPTPLPKAVLWRGAGEHSAVERLCDRSLLMVPPSRHPTTGKPYLFRSHAESPKKLAMPAVCPDWILRMPALDSACAGAFTLQCKEPAQLCGFATHRHHFIRFRARDVLEVLGDRKIDLASEWGLRLTARPQGNGWWPCHAFDRDDVHPSAAIHRDSGFYCDLGSGRRLGFFDLASVIGPYPDWRSALNDLGQRYGARSVA
jgi:hypothetical protein